jgi:predicted Fe-S protein YdhL (DUF1289 family)
MNPRDTPTGSPCVGRCSHNIGDIVCRGCGRTIEEVRDWNTFTDCEKIEVKRKAKRRHEMNNELENQSPAVAQGRRVELERDAERYRWLRDKAVDADGVYPMVSLTDDCGDQVSNWLFGEAVDRAIDAAMAAQQDGEGVV